MKNQLLLGATLFLMATPASAAPWSRGYAVSAYEPAFFYGGKSGTDQAGSDCPKGLNPELDYNALFRQKWRTAADYARLTAPLVPGGENPRTVRRNAIAHRGFRSDIETYVNPFTAPDPGVQEVTGKIAEGFNLDGNAATGGFTNPSGERGVDNAYYRAFGCGMSNRGAPYQSYLGMRANDKMLDGLFTIVIRVSGRKDAMNDDDAVVEIGYSPDRVIRDGTGHVGTDYSFRLARSAQYTKFKARVRNGQVETEQVAELHMPENAWYETNRGDALFKQGRMRLTLNGDGSLSGLVGGYRDWRDVYGKQTFNVPSGGESREVTYHQNQIGFYYSLKRNADGFPDPKTGQNTAISTAFRFKAVRAFVIDPKDPVVIDQPANPRSNIERGLFLKAIATRMISPEVPRGRGAATPAPEDGGQKPAGAPKPDGLQASKEASPATAIASATPVR